MLLRWTCTMPSTPTTNTKCSMAEKAVLSLPFITLLSISTVFTPPELDRLRWACAVPDSVNVVPLSPVYMLEYATSAWVWIPPLASITTVSTLEKVTVP